MEQQTWYEELLDGLPVSYYVTDDEHPANYSVKGLACQNAPHGVEVLLVEAPKINRGELEKICKARRKDRIAPVYVVGGNANQELLTIHGISESINESKIELNVSEAKCLFSKALNEDNYHSAELILFKHSEQRYFTNCGLFSEGHLFQALRRATDSKVNFDWNNKDILTNDVEKFLKSMNFQYSRYGMNNYTIGSNQETNALYTYHPQKLAHRGKDTSELYFSFSSAKKLRVNWIFYAFDHKIRIYYYDLITHIPRTQLKDIYFELDLSDMPKAKAKYLIELISPEAIRAGGVLEQLLISKNSDTTTD